MCLAVPGELCSVHGDDIARMGKVVFGGITREVSLACLPEAQPGDWVIVHAGMAISLLDRDEAAAALQAWQQTA